MSGLVCIVSSLLDLTSGLSFSSSRSIFKLVIISALPFPSLLVATPFTKEEGGGVEPTISKIEILQGIRDTFASYRNVKVVYIVLTLLP